MIEEMVADLRTRSGLIAFFEQLLGVRITAVRVEGDVLRLAGTGLKDLIIEVDLPPEVADPLSGTQL